MGNTYASAAGQQAYDNYVAQLNDKALDFYDRAYQRYADEGQNLYNQMNVVTGLDNTDYQRYRDGVNDYYNDLNYYNGRYNQEYGYDYGEYQDRVAADQWAQEFAFQKPAGSTRSRRTGRLESGIEAGSSGQIGRRTW